MKNKNLILISILIVILAIVLVFFVKYPGESGDGKLSKSVTNSGTDMNRVLTSKIVNISHIRYLEENCEMFYHYLEKYAETENCPKGLKCRKVMQEGICKPDYLMHYYANTPIQDEWEGLEIKVYYCEDTGEYYEIDYDHTYYELNPDGTTSPQPPSVEVQVYNYFNKNPCTNDLRMWI